MAQCHKHRSPYTTFYELGGTHHTEDHVVLDALELAGRAERELRSGFYDYIKVECFNREEAEIFKRVFSQKLPPDLFRKVIFTWLVFRDSSYGQHNKTM